MKINEADLRTIIEEELKAFKDRKNVANSKHPSDVEMIEDPNVGGILSDDFEHIPEDVPADVEKPQARVQDLIPIVKEHKYSLKSVLEEMRFVGGMGFHSASPPSESEGLEEACGCGDPDMVMQHTPSDHVIKSLEAAVEKEEPRDLDYDKGEGSMARSQLRRATKYSQQLGEMIHGDDDLPEWVDAKITKASDYLGSVYHYLDYELNGKR
jgi:hypothetical protein